MPLKWYGLTGGIATGKSTVAQLLQSRGFPVIDADQIAHQLTEKNQPGYDQIVKDFGRGILDADQNIDRKKLAQIIFNNPAEKDKLESILHPLIQQKVRSLKTEYIAQNFSMCFYDVPLLFEKKLETQFDAVILVYAQPQIQLQRLMDRNQLTLAEAQARIKNQSPMPDKIKKSHFCLDNSTDVRDLEAQVETLCALLASQNNSSLT